MKSIELPKIDEAAMYASIREFKKLMLSLIDAARKIEVSLKNLTNEHSKKDDVWNKNFKRKVPYYRQNQRF